jgi:hypothetical protein
MLLKLENGVEVEAPPMAVIVAGLQSLRNPDNTFAILESEPGTYVQVALNRDGSFTLEYQEGTLDQHFEATRPVTLDELIRAFAAYAERRPWKSLFPWRPLRLR